METQGGFGARVRIACNGVKGSLEEERYSGLLVSILLCSDAFTVSVTSFPKRLPLLFEGSHLKSSSEDCSQATEQFFP